MSLETERQSDKKLEDADAALLWGPGVPNVTTEKLAQWRREIADARIRLGDEDLPKNLQRFYWTMVDCRETCIRLSGADFEAELELIDREIEAALRPCLAISPPQTGWSTSFDNRQRFHGGRINRPAGFALCFRLPAATLVLRVFDDAARGEHFDMTRGICRRSFVRWMAGLLLAFSFIETANAQHGERYFIEFRARPSTYIGHTFIEYGRTDRAGRVVESNRVGLIPEEDAWKGLVFPVRGSIREYKDDRRLASTVIYRRSLTAAEYARVVVAVRKLQAREHLWHGFFFNCNDFAIAIAQLLHMRHLPSLTPPDVWVQALAALN